MIAKADLNHGDMSRTFWAHSGTPDNRLDWQDLAEHLRAVAEIASDLGEPLGIGRAGFRAGLMHDLGKYHPSFTASHHGRGCPN